MPNRFKSGADNPNWKGGRVIEPRGYVLVRVGKQHPLADVRGYAYEHRLVAQASFPRPLTRADKVHHDNEQRGDNAPVNLEVLGHAEHMALHRTAGKALRMPGEGNPVVPCGCGCGGIFSKFDADGRPRVYITGHNPSKRDPATGRLISGGG